MAARPEDRAAQGPTNRLDFLAAGRRFAIVGASSLRGKELKELLTGRGISSDSIRLLDDEVAAGTLTEAGGEVAFIQLLDPESIRAGDIVFFAGDPAFTARHWEAAVRAGAAVIDLSGALGDRPEARPWIPSLASVLAPPEPLGGNVFYSPPAAAVISTTIVAGLAALSLRRLAFVFFQSVSEHGQAGIDELEAQTSKLLSFQPISTELFDTQVAFSLLERFGATSSRRLSETRERLARDVHRYLAGRAPTPALQLVYAPVFYGLAFTAFLELSAPRAASDIEQAMETVGIEIERGEDAAPSNISVGGQEKTILAPVVRDAGLEAGYWLWGAADNVRLTVANAVAIAEKLFAF